MKEAVSKNKHGQVVLRLTIEQAIIVSELLGATNDRNIGLALPGCRLHPVYDKLHGLLGKQPSINGYVSDVRFKGSNGKELK